GGEPGPARNRREPRPMAAQLRPRISLLLAPEGLPEGRRGVCGRRQETARPSDHDADGRSSGGKRRLDRDLANDFSGAVRVFKGQERSKSGDEGTAGAESAGR